MCNILAHVTFTGERNLLAAISVSNLYHLDQVSLNIDTISLQQTSKGANPRNIFQSIKKKKKRK